MRGSLSVSVYVCMRVGLVFWKKDTAAVAGVVFPTIRELENCAAGVVWDGVASLRVGLQSGKAWRSKKSDCPWTECD